MFVLELLLCCVFALAFSPTVVVVPLDFSMHIDPHEGGLSNCVRLLRTLATGGHCDQPRSGAQGSVGGAGGPSVPGSGEGGGSKAARCVLMIVFAEEFWTPRSTIFILFVKWMII